MDNKKRNRIINKLMKIEEGDPSKFIYSNVADDGSGIGYNNYSFEQLVLYMGFQKAFDMANYYRKSVNKKFCQSKLVKDFLLLFANCFQATIDAGDCMFIVCVDPDGKMYDPPGDYLMFREWEAAEKIMHEKWDRTWVSGFADEIDYEFKKLVKNDSDSERLPADSGPAAEESPDEWP